MQRLNFAVPVALAFWYTDQIFVLLMVTCAIVLACHGGYRLLVTHSR